MPALVHHCSSTGEHFSLCLRLQHPAPTQHRNNANSNAVLTSWDVSRSYEQVMKLAEGSVAIPQGKDLSWLLGMRPVSLWGPHDVY